MQSFENFFTWVSEEPTTKELIPYDDVNSRTLQYAFNHKIAQINLLILQNNSSSFVYTVVFNYENNAHKQISGNGLGERRVFGCSGPLPHVIDIDDNSVSLDSKWSTSFWRVAWIHLDPVTGEIGFYSSENAYLLEKGYREKKLSEVVSVKLSNGSELLVTVKFSSHSDIHTQTTGPGFRELRRVCLKGSSDETKLNIYQWPIDGSIDSGRYRFSETENLFLTKTIHCNEFFMEEEALPLTYFGRLNDISFALQQISFNSEHLQKIAANLKTQPYIDAVNCISQTYSISPNIAIFEIMHKIERVWLEQGYLKLNEHHIYELQDTLLDNLQDLYNEDILKREFSSRMALCNSRLATAAVFFLLGGL